MRLVIARSWDGHSLPTADRALVEVESWPGELEIRCDAPFWDDPAPPAPAGSLEGLWDWEVVEVFLATAGQEPERVHYLEVELGPHGHFLGLGFAGVRRSRERGLPIDFEVSSRGGGRWRGRASVPTRFLPPRPWSVNACSSHGPANDRVYGSAVALPGPLPDFHQPAAFRDWEGP